MTDSYQLLLPPLIPAVAALLVLALRSRPAVRDCVPVMGAVAARLSSVVIITSDNPRSEDPAAIISQIIVESVFLTTMAGYIGLVAGVG